MIRKTHIVAVILLAGTLSADRAVSSTAHQYRAVNETVAQRLATQLSRQLQSERTATIHLFELRPHVAPPQVLQPAPVDVSEPGRLLLSPFHFRLPPPVL